MVNDQTDRIFLVNDRGLVQCLREIGAETPTLYGKVVEPEGEGEQPAGEDVNPFEAPAAEPAAEDDVDSLRRRGCGSRSGRSAGRRAGGRRESV